MRFRWVGVFAFVVASCSGNASPSTTAAIGTTTVPSVTSTSAAASADSPAVELVRIDDPTFDSGVLNAVVEAGPGLVAVGSDELPEDAAVWVSADGRSWERIVSDAFGGEKDSNGLDGTQVMTDVAAGDAGIVAVGAYERKADRDIDAGVWFSTDGLDWVRVDDDSLQSTGEDRIFSVVVHGGRFIAVGQGPGPVGSGERRPAIWVSADGLDWERLSGPALRIDASISQVATDGSRLYAVGSTGHVLRPAVWFSDDGDNWNVVKDTIEGGEVGRDQDLAMTSVEVTANGLVAGGAFGFPAQAVFWSADDVFEWTLNEVTADSGWPNAPVNVEAMKAFGDELIAVGWARLDATRFPPISLAQVWVSDDGGMKWPQVPRATTSLASEGPGAPWHVGSMTDVIEFRSGFVITGFVSHQGATLPGPFYRQAVWLGSAG